LGRFLAQAAALVRQALSLQPTNRCALLLAVYCELSCGDTDGALALLRRSHRASEAAVDAAGGGPGLAA
jgi:hypothetical protein